MGKKCLLACAFVAVAILGFESVASAQDVDADLVPDLFDNCVEVPNGLNEAPNNQVDADGDGYGNACDADFNQSGFVGLADYNALWTCYGQIGSCPSGQLFAPLDLDVDGLIAATDVARLLSQIGAPFAAPSGLSCADPTLNTTLIGGPDPVCD